MYKEILMTCMNAEVEYLLLAEKIFVRSSYPNNFFFSFQLFRVGFLSLSVAYLRYLIQSDLEYPLIVQVSVRSQYFVRLLSQCWITGGPTIHPPIEGLLPPTGIEPTQFRNLALKVAGLQVHATTPSEGKGNFKD